MLGNWAYNIAEAASHELGHNLGLSHDGAVAHGDVDAQGYYAGHGSGYVSWAPIMGVGYYCNVTQWSKGEYTYANNPEDDLAIIQKALYVFRGLGRFRCWRDKYIPLIIKL